LLQQYIVKFFNFSYYSVFLITNNKNRIFLFEISRLLSHTRHIYPPQQPTHSPQPHCTTTTPGSLLITLHHTLLCVSSHCTMQARFYLLLLLCACFPFLVISGMNFYLKVNHNSILILLFDSFLLILMQKGPCDFSATWIIDAISCALNESVTIGNLTLSNEAELQLNGNITLNVTHSFNVDEDSSVYCSGNSPLSPFSIFISLTSLPPLSSHLLSPLFSLPPSLSHTAHSLVKIGINDINIGMPGTPLPVVTLNGTIYYVNNLNIYSDSVTFAPGSQVNFLNGVSLEKRREKRREKRAILLTPTFANLTIVSSGDVQILGEFSSLYQMNINSSSLNNQASIRCVSTSLAVDNFVNSNNDISSDYISIEGKTIELHSSLVSSSDNDVGLGLFFFLLPPLNIYICF